MIRFFHRYQKVIFWIIVAVILPLFAVTSVMMDLLMGPSNPPVGKLYGDEVDQSDFDEVKERLDRYARARFGQRGVTGEGAWNHLLFVRESERAGIEVSDEDVAKEVQDWWKEKWTQEEVQKRLATEGPRADALRRFEIEQEIKVQARFDADAYRDWLRRADTNPAEFEQTVAEFLKIDRLRDIARLDAKPTPQQVFDAYEKEKHRRKVRHAAFTPDPFRAKEAKDLTDKELEDQYQKTPDRWRVPMQVALEYVSVDFTERAKASPEPTPEEVEAEYTKLKDARYRIRVPPAFAKGWVHERFVAPLYRRPALPPPAVVYRPLTLEAVRTEVASAVKLEKAREELKRRVDAARTLAAAGLTPYRLAARLGAKPADEASVAAGLFEGIALGYGLKHGKVGPMRVNELNSVPEVKSFRILTDAEMMRPLVEVSPVRLGRDIGIAASPDFPNISFYRVLSRTKERVKPLDEVKDEVVRSLVLGTDADLLQYYNAHSVAYKTPEQATVVYVFAPYARFLRLDEVKKIEDEAKRSEKARELAEEALKKAIDRYEADRKRPGGSADLEGAGLAENLDASTLEGVDLAKPVLPEEITAPEVSARLAQKRDKIGDVSPVSENDKKTGVFAYVVKSRRDGKIPALDDVKEKVRADYLTEVAWRRAQAAASEAARDVADGKKDLVEIAEKHGLVVKETGFFARDAKLEDVAADLVALKDAGGSLVPQVFNLAELGQAVATPFTEPGEAKRAFVVQYVEREAADLAGFAAAEVEMRRKVREELRSPVQPWMVAYLRDAPNVQRELSFQRQVQAEAYGLGDDHLREAYELRYGPDGLAHVEAAHIFFKPDEDTLKATLDLKAKELAEKALADIRGGQPFERVARRQSEDKRTRATKGEIGFVRRATLVADYGEDFARAVFDQPANELAGPVESTKGWHVVQVLERRGDERQIRHVVFFKESDTRRADPAIRAAAMAKSREKADKALARIRAGEAFERVGAEVTDDRDALRKKAYERLTTFEAKALEQKPQEIGPVLVFEDGARLIVTEPRGRDDPRLRDIKAVTVRHIFARGKGDEPRRRLEAIREDLVEEKQDIAESGRSGSRRGGTWGQFIEVFEEKAEDVSDAPSGKRGGVVGVVYEPEEVVKYGPSFREALYGLKAGEISGIVEGKDGLHIIKCHRLVKKTFEEARPDVLDSLVEAVEF